VCGGWIHKGCLIQLLQKFGREGDHVTDDTVICGKLCFNKSTKNISTNTKAKRAFWHNDGPDNSEESSLSILLDWLSSQPNYKRWRGGDKNSPQTKLTICSEILQIIKDAGIETERSPKDVHYKISTMEQQFRRAVDFLDGTGAGIEDERTLKEAVQKICPYYYELEGVMMDRQSSRPLAENYETSDSDDLNDKGDNQANVESSEDNVSIDVSHCSSSKRSSIPVKHLNARKKVKGRDNFADINEMLILRRQQFSFDQEYKKMQAQREEKTAASQVLLNNAMIKKTDTEREILSIEAKAALLLKRKQLLDAGVLKDDIDLLLPLPSKVAELN